MAPPRPSLANMFSISFTYRVSHHKCSSATVNKLLQTFQPIKHEILIYVRKEYTNDFSFSFISIPQLQMELFPLVPNENEPECIVY